MQQLVDGADGAVNGAVVDEIIRILCTGIERLHLDVHGRESVFLHIQVIGGKDVLSAGKLDHLGDIIPRLPHIDAAVGADVEKCHGFSGVFAGADSIQLPGLRLKKRLCRLGFPQQQPVELDPLHAPQRVGLIAGVFHQHGDSQRLQLLPNLRTVIDHGGLYRQFTAAGEDRLIVWRIVLSRIFQRAVFHGALNIRQTPSGFGGAGHVNAVQCTDAVKQIHGGAGCHIEIVQRLLKNGDAVIHTGWRRFALRYQQVLVFAGDGDEGILAVVVHGKFLGVFQRHVSRGGTVCPGAAGGGLRRSRSAGKK